jgi:hypothetical protein
MILKIIVLLFIIFISCIINVLVLRYSIKNKINNLDYKSVNKYPISLKKVYLIINLFSLNVWLVYDMNDRDWEEYKQKLPIFYIGLEYYKNNTNIVFFNSPNSTKIIRKKIIFKECILISQIFSFHFNKKNIKFIVYLSNSLNIKNPVKYDMDNDYIEFFSKKKKSYKSNNNILLNTPHELAEVIFDFGNSNLYIKNNQHVNNRDYKKIINQEIEQSIPLYSYWKTLIIIIILITSYIYNIGIY